ncbi:MAG: hypothetical protein ACLGIN_06430 [Candidatus Sericytochromatia bacterium]
MAKLKVNWAPDKLQTLDEVLEQPGYYLNAISGDLFRYDGNASEATRRDAEAITRAMAEGTAPTLVSDRIWLLITDDLDLTEGDVRGMIHDVFHLRMQEQGRLVSTVVVRLP